MKIALIREGKIPLDRRVPLTPGQAKQLEDQFSDVQVVCQKSEIRSYSEKEYQNKEIQVVEDVSNCDVMLGVKEVPIHELIPNKTYFFFSHTIKKQPYNRGLLQAVLDKKIRLIDYECLKNKTGKRVVAFGRYAGIVGAYNGILTYGKKFNLFDLKRAKDCFDLEELHKEFDKVILPPIKITITGGGRVAHGAMEVLDGMKIKKVDPKEFLQSEFNYPVYTQLNSEDYHIKNEGGTFDIQEFYDHPEKFSGNFLPYVKVTNLLIAAAYWDPQAPVLFTREDMLDSDFAIKVIADITCDIEGSIPSTKKPSTIDDPIYDYNPKEDQVMGAFSLPENVSVMAVDNLPCELPRDASRDFGKELLDNVLPNLIEGDTDKMIENATIAKDGALMPKFMYLTDYVNANE